MMESHLGRAFASDNSALVHLEQESPSDTNASMFERRPCNIPTEQHLYNNIDSRHRVANPVVSKKTDQGSQASFILIS